jgi:hypothetical protein
VQRANASLLIGTSSWKEQFVEALTVSASNESDQKKPSGLDYVMHFVTLFWKILFAFVPPTGMSLDPPPALSRLVLCRYVQGVLLLRGVDPLHRSRYGGNRRCGLPFRRHSRHGGFGYRHRVRCSGNQHTR